MRLEDGSVIVGEPIDWTRAAGADRSALAARLGPGTYAYKRKIGAAWVLDAAEPRTRSVRGQRNNVLSVGGAPEPVLFAPAPPHVVPLARGGVAITAALRHGAGDALAVLWSEGDHGERRAVMRVVAREDEHLVLRAILPISTGRATLAFELPDGRRVGREEDGAPFAWERPTDGSPRWLADAVLYTVFVDRFRPARPRVGWAIDPGPHVAAGGHLDGVRRALPELADLGVTALYLTPVQLAASAHRYDVVDPLVVDPALGGEEAFRALVEDVHARGMRILCDLAVGHVGRGFPAYEEVQRDGRAATRAGWFLWREDGALAMYGERDDAPLLDLDHAEVRALVVATAEALARRGVDGLRLDAAADVPMDLAIAVRRAVRAIRPDAAVVGELVPRHAWRWHRAGALDAATDFAFHAVATDFLAHGAIDAAEARARLVEAEVARGTPEEAAVRFLSTHDHPRFATLAALGGRAGVAPLGLAWLLAWPGVPMLLYGEELGLRADRTAQAENAWADRMPFPFPDAQRDDGLRPLVRQLLAARAASPALRRGDLEVTLAEGDLLAFRRSAEGEVVDVVLNRGDVEIAIALEDDEREGIEPLVTVGDVAVDGDAVTLGPRSAILARRPVRCPTRAAIAANERARDRDMALGLEVATARPTRVDFALTERCNLRCAHCITLAPERTAAGSARTLSPAIVDRLRGDLAFAEYAGFVHGGEPLVAEVIWDVLEALRQARAGLGARAHVLTNGVRLGEATLLRLADAGVTSLSVSLDGATAATNDAVRLGGRFDAIVRNLEATARLRRERGLDVRLGVSTVVLPGNVGELAAVIELAARLGLDWVKLEEPVASTPFADAALRALDPSRTRDAVAAAASRARELGVVLVDHVDPPRVWRCRLPEEPLAAAFLAADEHANRSTIHPCRAPWETACVEPNGDVRLGDFHGPILGNLMEASLASLWNEPGARATRRRGVTERLCAGPAPPGAC
jgi:glycosidase/MoaA/NifB/PqqE/SkfB family radical SAM enzyme